MNAEANTAFEKWNELFSSVQEGWRNGLIKVDLSDSKADLYDVANEILMRRMQERLVETLQGMAPAIAPNTPYTSLTLGNKFFMTMDQQQQRIFFHRIFNLRLESISVGEATDKSTESPAITINTSALLESLPQLHAPLRFLIVSNFALNRQSDVQALSNIIISKRDIRTLDCVRLDNIECHKDDSDESDGFLDPLFRAASGLDAFCVSTKTCSVHSSLVSPAALRALIYGGNRLTALHLRGLGLTDKHVDAIVNGLSIPGTHLNYLNLVSNPGITAQGYGALLNLMNRANVVGFGASGGRWIGFCVDDRAWEAKLNLVSEMNTCYGRLEYLTNGTFTSEEHKLQWLEMVAGLPFSNDDDEGDDDDEDDEDDEDQKEEDRKKSDAKLLNFIWYTLCQNPEMMQVSQAPTRTRN
jgi:hypothetical protein